MKGSYYELVQRSESVPFVPRHPNLNPISDRDPELETRLSCTQ